MNSQTPFISGRILRLALLTLSAFLTTPLTRAQCCGDLDTGFNPGYGANNTVRASVRQSDGKIIMGGAFTTFYGSTRYYLARVTTGGANDSSYNAAVNGTVMAMALDTSDGTERLVAVGSFTQANSYYSVTATARFLTNGNYDTSFSSPNIDVYPTSVAVQSDGKILIGGYHNYVGGYYRPRIARLNANGSVDTTFNAGSIDGGVYAIKVLSGGQILIGGYFTSVGSYPNNYSRGCLAKLNSDGSVSTSLPANNLSLANNTVYAIDVIGSSYIIIGGDFTQVNDTSCPYLAKLEFNGGLTVPSTAPNATVRVVNSIPNANGDYVIGGDFTTIGGTTAQGFARFDGSDDSMACSGDTGFTGGTVQTISLLTTFPNKAFCGGTFTGYDGTTRTRLAQIFIECD
jgi:uncharacterized delta-60 repeat protein